MQLIKKMFGRTPDASAAPGSESVQFQESDGNSEPGSRNALRRDLVQVVLRDSMRRHGIPTAWIDCRILSVVNRAQRSGMLVQFIVRDGTDRLLTYVPAFQTSFMEEIARFDPRADDWLFNVSWQFLQVNAKVASPMPDPAVWHGTAPGAPLAQSGAAASSAPLAADAATPATAAQTPAPTALPSESSVPAAAAVSPDSSADADLMEDLQALYATMRQSGGPGATRPVGESDFESTRPGIEPTTSPVPPAKSW